MKNLINKLWIRDSQELQLLNGDVLSLETTNINFRITNTRNIINLFKDNESLLREYLVANSFNYNQSDRPSAEVNVEDLIVSHSNNEYGKNLSEQIEIVDKLTDIIHGEGERSTVIRVNNDRDNDSNELYMDEDIKGRNLFDDILFKFYDETNFMGISYFKNDNDERSIYTLNIVDDDFYNLLKEVIVKGASLSLLRLYLVTQDLKLNNIKYYDHFVIKNDHKERDIYAPNEKLKDSLRHVMRVLNSAYDNSFDHQFAYIANKSIKDNARKHSDFKYSVKMDIEGFFDNCRYMDSRKYLGILFGKYLNYKIENKFNDTLKEVIINPNTKGLYQGSPISGVLSNVILRKSIIYLVNILDNEYGPSNYHLSVYADDITISFNEKPNVKEIINKVEYTFKYYNLAFRLNSKKTRLVRKNGRKITGVRINHNDELTIPRKLYMFLRTVLHNLNQGNEITIGISKLRGLLSYSKFIDETGKINRLLDKYPNVVKKYKL